MEATTVSRKESRLGLLNKAIEGMRRLPETSDDLGVATALARVAALTDNLPVTNHMQSAALHKMASMCFKAAGETKLAKREDGHMLMILYEHVTSGRGISGSGFEPFRDHRARDIVEQESSEERMKIARAIEVAMIAFVSLNMKRPEELDNPQRTIMMMTSDTYPQEGGAVSNVISWLRRRAGSA
ncbi:MAG: hypothetical protein KGH94_04015 [Candidatus Micrarchaeota archaeon]|nr:hypothetical protein [Candidatus Micrarchaeota archaeon]